MLILSKLILNRNIIFKKINNLILNQCKHYSTFTISFDEIFSLILLNMDININNILFETNNKIYLINFLSKYLHNLFFLS